MRTNTVYEIVGHPGGSTLDAQGGSRIFDLNYKGALTLKNVTLINGRATGDGGAIRLRSRMPPGLGMSAINMNHAQAARLTIRGGAIRDCEATNDGGAVAAIADSTMMSSAASRAPASRPARLPGLLLRLLPKPCRPALSPTGVDTNFVRVEISGCRAGNRGGGIFLKDQNLNVADTRFLNNSAASGGAIAVYIPMTVQIKRSRCAPRSTLLLSSQRN